jgi:chromosome segregation ATPase
VSTTLPIESIGDFRLRQRIHELEDIIRNQESQMRGLHEENQILQENYAESKSDSAELAFERDSWKSKFEVAEARVEDLKETLEIERKRFDSLLGHSHEVEEGIRARVGLLKKPDGASGTPGTPEPIRTRRVPWQVQQARLEADSKEKYWKDRVKAVEESDKAAGTKNVNNGGESNSTEGHNDRTEPS